MSEFYPVISAINEQEIVFNNSCHISYKIQLLQSNVSNHTLYFSQLVTDV